MIFNIFIKTKNRHNDSDHFASNCLHIYINPNYSKYDLTRLAKKILENILIIQFQDINIVFDTNAISTDIVFMILFYLKTEKCNKNIFFNNETFFNNNADKINFNNIFDMFDQYMTCVDSRQSMMNMNAYCNKIDSILYKYKIQHEKIICNSQSKFNMIYSVGKGSKYNPVLYIIGFTKTNIQDIKSYKFDMCYAGKGVVYDTGGLGIKPAQYMTDMHTDMAGSALAFFSCLYSYLYHGIESLCVIPIAENMVDGNSYLNGDIITSYCNKRVHVRHTDAEGRLILGDAISYVSRNYKYNNLVVMATLTGAAFIVSGANMSIGMSDNKTFMEKIKISFDNSYEYIIELPMYDIYKEYITDSQKVYGSTIDIHNSSKEKGASCITAAKFIEFFACKKNHKSYTHIDIANYFESYITNNTNISMSNLFITMSNILIGDNILNTLFNK